MSAAARLAVVQELLAAHLGRPYRPGETDCFLLACRVADALDPALGLAARYGGRYSTLAGARKALRREGCRSIGELFARHLEEIGPAAARVGDIGIVRVGGPVAAEHAAVCAGDRFVARVEAGRLDVPLAEAVQAFRVAA